MLGGVAVAALVIAPLAFADATITSSGPLTSIEITSDLNCAVNHSGDSASEFYGGTACGTLLASGGTLYGPANIPAGGSASPRTTWSAVSQTAVTGSGTSGDPYKIVTVVDAGTSGLRITETDTYVVGQESYRTDISISNTGSTSAAGVVYHAGDCYLQGSDFGYGSYDSSTGAIACVATSGRIEQFYPLSGGSNFSEYTETFYDSMWAQIGTQNPFPDSCDCTTNEDNSAGLSWSFTIPAGQSVTRSLLTTFSPLGIQPLTTTKTADAGSAASGGPDGYTITIHNPNSGDASIDSITDTLPAGFSYTAGTSSGATTSNPSISGQDLTWSGPFTVPGNGVLTLHFAVAVAASPGTYYNNAGGTSTDSTVAPTGDTAPITVGAPTDTTAPACMLTATVTGPPKQIQVTVQDTGSGLATVTVTTSANATTVVPPFTPGSTDPLVVTSTKVNPTTSSSLALTVKDVAGNTTHCDPVWGGTRMTAQAARSHRQKAQSGQYAHPSRREGLT
ncbi:MAG: hypothetical protein ACRDL2_13015 [Gaiellaceae bacterium]